MRTAVPPLQIEDSGLASLVARSAHIVIVAVMTIIVLLGFWPFYSSLFGGGTGAHWIVYLHAAVFSGWMVLLSTQIVLVFRRRVGMHQRLGRAGIFYGFLVLVLGLVITVAAPIQHVIAGRWTLDEAAGFLILPLGDMLLFGGFFAAGIVYRKKKELHKRLMVLATIALLFAPAARIGGDIGPWAMLLIWLLPLGLAVAHDAVFRRRIERVYVFGAAVLLVAFARIGLMESEMWLGVGRQLLRLWLPTA
jgi:hypothetical protein